MKKIIFLVGVMLSASFFFSYANAPFGSCATGGPNDKCNGYCVTMWDGQGNQTYKCVKPEGQTPDCYNKALGVIDE